MTAYRPDIDMLRAIAVSSVVVFHLYPESLMQGYLGVDIFFVISGYLITLALWNESSSRAFSIANFYERRIRRLMPALIFMLAILTPISTLILLPSDLTGYGKSLLASLAFVANIYFWRDTNYFSPDAETRPLLHLWSLSVEEQFYLIFPVLLWLLARYAARYALLGVTGVTAISLALNIAALRYDASGPAFFMLPTRAWELGCGAILALAPSRWQPDVKCSQALMFAGMALVAASLVVPMPATVPAPILCVFATSIVIFAGRYQTAPIIFRLRPVIFVGLISYSLYLWHWPIIVLLKYYLVTDTINPLISLMSVILMLALAIFSWRYVERPFRKRTTSRASVYRHAAAGVASLFIAGSLLVAYSGLPWRVPQLAANYNAAVGTNFRCAVNDFFAFGASRACALNLPSGKPYEAELVLLGNSHAQMYAPAWRRITAETDTTSLLVPLNGCFPTVLKNLSPKCLIAANTNLTEVARMPAKVVVIGFNWSAVDPSIVEAVDDLVARINETGKRAILIGPLAEPGWNLAAETSKRIAFGHELTGEMDTPAQAFYDRFGSWIRHFEDRRDLVFVRPDTIQCGPEKCRYVIDDRPIFADSNHIAQAELPRFEPMFRAGLEEARRMVPLR